MALERSRRSFPAGAEESPYAERLRSQFSRGTGGRRRCRPAPGQRADHLGQGKAGPGAVAALPWSAGSGAIAAGPERTVSEVGPAHADGEFRDSSRGVPDLRVGLWPAAVRDAP